MKLIKSIVRPHKVDDVREALEKLSIAGMTVTDVRGHGRGPLTSRGCLRSLIAVHVQWQAEDELVDALLFADATESVCVTSVISAPNRGHWLDRRRIRVGHCQTDAPLADVNTKKPGQGRALGVATTRLMRAVWSGSRSTNSGQIAISTIP